MADTIISIDRTTTVANAVVSIRDKIILQEYPAGSMLTEITLSEEHDASRGSIRTALQALENEGLIVTLSNGRKQVVGITEKFVFDLNEIRKLLECEAARLVIAKDHVNYTGLASSVELFNSVENAPAEVMRVERANANSEFHRALFEMSNNRSLLQCWATIEPTIAALAKFNSETLDTKKHKDDYINTHTKLLSMIISRDETVIEYLRSHIDDARRDTMIGLKELGCL